MLGIPMETITLDKLWLTTLHSKDSRQFPQVVMHTVVTTQYETCGHILSHLGNLYIKGLFVWATITVLSEHLTFQLGYPILASAPSYKILKLWE